MISYFASIVTLLLIRFLVVFVKKDSRKEKSILVVLIYCAYTILVSTIFYDKLIEKVCILSVRDAISAVSLIAVVGIIEVQTLQLLRKSEYLTIVSSNDIEASVGTNSARAMVFICVASAFWEEWLFRIIPFCVVIDGNLLTLSVMLLGSSLCFALQHFGQGAPQVIYSFFFGLFFSICMLVSSSPLAIILAHATGNLFVAFVTRPTLNLYRAEPVARLH